MKKYFKWTKKVQQSVERLCQKMLVLHSTFAGKRWTLIHYIIELRRKKELKVEQKSCQKIICELSWWQNENG